MASYTMQIPAMSSTIASMNSPTAASMASSASMTSSAAASMASSPIAFLRPMNALSSPVSLLRPMKLWADMAEDDSLCSPHKRRFFGNRTLEKMDTVPRLLQGASPSTRDLNTLPSPSLSRFKGEATPQSSADLAAFYESLPALASLQSPRKSYYCVDMPPIQEQPLVLQQIQTVATLDPSVHINRARAMTPVSEEVVQHKNEAPRVNLRTEITRTDGRWRCTFFVGIEETRDFGFAKRFIGFRGSNMKAIVAQCPGTKIRLRGKGSGFKDQATGYESRDPLQINVNSLNFDEYVRAQAMVVDLLRPIYAEYEAYSGVRVYINRVGSAHNGKLS